MSSFVYRLYDYRDMLLYVGLTDDVLVRLRTHRSQQPWSGEINHFTFREFSERDHAARVERRAIRLLRPAKNNPKAPPKPWPQKPCLWERERGEGCAHDWAFMLTRGFVVCRKCGEQSMGKLRCKRFKKEQSN